MSREILKHFSFRTHYDDVVFCRRTADISENSAAAEVAASTTSSMLNLVSMSVTQKALKKRNAGSTINSPLRMA